MLLFGEAFFKNPVYGYLMDVYVSPSFRRKGIAKSMISQILTWFEATEVSTIHLDASRVSGDLYAKMGFASSIQMTLKQKQA